MVNLMKFPTKERELKIVEESACNYREIGTNLLNDKTGKIVSAIEKAADGVPEKALHTIYSRWITEDEDHSWRKLAQCLRDCDLNVLASNIEKHFGLFPPQQPQEGKSF